MKGSRVRKGGPAPHLVAAMASTLVLVVGTAVTAYFVEVRGIGIRAELQTTRAIELQILGAALLGVVVLTQLCVARAVNSARAGGGAGKERALLARALETDYADPEALGEFESVPELRDLVAMLMAEKSQVRELGDRLETLRGELDGLCEGMRRSGQDLGRMREEGSSEVVVQMASLWNDLVGRFHDAEAKIADAAAALAPERDKPFGEVSIAPVATLEQVAGVATLVARLDDLEAELNRLRGAVAQPGTRSGGQVAPDVFAASRDETAFDFVPQPNRDVVLDVPSVPARPVLGAASSDPWKVRASATTPVGEDADWGTVTPVEPPRQAATWNAPGLVAPTRDIFLSDDGVAQGAEPSTTASAPNFDDMAFPHFIGKPVKSIPDRVEVTYEAQTGEDVVDLPASALLFESEDEEAQAEDGVLDLRALGALEFDR